MAQPERPLRADAVRNRARVLAVAYETMAVEGLSVPIDEIARRAGVGAGTVYRHFPTKEALFGAVVEERLQQMVTSGRDLLRAAVPGDALYSFIKWMVIQGAADLGLAQAMAGYGIDVNVVAPQAEAEFLGLLGDLLAAAQQAGTARSDVTVPEVKALIVGAQAMQGYNPAVAERVIDIVLDGLRPR
ncbi:TetR/AcrR family transcriptional regulator [Mycolicibacterium hodleri]|uniref:TetR/AcrR family transcriptional regulator n=1 Tax=Mycolicibacterium hodleri TaxID=49897 RepID=A0A502E541_9MYCO|nr:TetR/AcrR family transcriptional regulator [Mycolicibacterium hodleri]TPG31550.1 TetR/AcrR family transcriptional regulator [Mycolicibacterium hodleri]